MKPKRQTKTTTPDHGILKTPAQSWSDPSFVDHYNRLYGMGEKDIVDYLTPLDLNSEDQLVDFGCGSGGVLLFASEVVGRALGIDGSPDQVKLARDALSGRPNVEIRQGDFLSCPLDGYSFSKAGMRKALHHLTDPQKETFFGRVAPFFRHGALFLVEDAIFDFPVSELRRRMPQVTREAEKYYGERWDKIRRDFLGTITDEFPTGIDHLSACLGKAGFRVVSTRFRTCFFARVLAERVQR